jgi:hypothetical protein
MCTTGEPPSGPEQSLETEVQDAEYRDVLAIQSKDILFEMI